MQRNFVIKNSTTGNCMTENKSRDPLEGKTLEMILNTLVDHYGWEELGEKIRIRCFTNNPGIKSSLTFLRRTPWARTKVEKLYLRLVTGNKRSKPKKKNFS